jgi:hypothetical protein
VIEPDIAVTSGVIVANPSGHHTLAWRPFFGFEQIMSNSKAARVADAAIPPPDFRIVCITCDSLGIIFDCPEGAASSTQIKCRHCGAPRGTLGELRKLSCSDRRDLFDV